MRERLLRKNILFLPMEGKRVPLRVANRGRIGIRVRQRVKKNDKYKEVRTGLEIGLYRVAEMNYCTILYMQNSDKIDTYNYNSKPVSMNVINFDENF